MNTQVKINHNEPLHVIYESTDVSTWEQYKRQDAYQNKRRYFIKQRICGFVLVSLSILIPFLLDGDATACIITLPLGIWLIFTRQRAMCF